MPRRYCLLVAASALLAGCAYDPYTGLFYPCCAYPPPAYGYPAASPAYGAPPASAPAAAPAPQWGGPQSQENMGPGAGPGGGRGRGNLRTRFATANVTQDGRLTRQQAATAGWRAVAKNFDMIDVQHKGYVTVPEIRAWRAGRQNMRGSLRQQNGGGYGQPNGPGGYPPPDGPGG